MAELNLEIVTPKRIAWKGVAMDVQAPGELGEFGVLPQHIPFLTVLKPGIVKVKTSTGELKFKVGAGFAEAGPDRVVLLADTCEEIK
jgi:F-type H+-transporting ATPase subunit epsilon